MLYFALFFRSISTSLCLFTILKFLLFRPFWAAQTEQIGLLCVWWTLMSVCSVGHRSPAKWHDVLSEARVSDLRLMVCLWKTHSLSFSLSLSLFSFHSWCVYVRLIRGCRLSNHQILPVSLLSCTSCDLAEETWICM